MNRLFTNALRLLGGSLMAASLAVLAPAQNDYNANLGSAAHVEAGNRSTLHAEGWMFEWWSQTLTSPSGAVYDVSGTYGTGSYPQNFTPGWDGTDLQMVTLNEPGVWTIYRYEGFNFDARGVGTSSTYVYGHITVSGGSGNPPGNTTGTGPDKYYTITPPQTINVSLTTVDFGLGPKADGDWIVSTTTGGIAVPGGSLPTDGSYKLVGTYGYSIEDWNWTISNGNGEYRLDNVETGTGNVYARQDPVATPPSVSVSITINKTVGQSANPWQDAYNAYADNNGHASGREQESFSRPPGSSASFTSNSVTFDVVGTYTYSLLIGVENNWGQEIGTDSVNVAYVVTSGTPPPVTPTAVTFTFGNLSHAYDGSVKYATVTPSPAGATYTSSLAGGPAAGSYTVTAIGTGSYSGSGSATLVINPPGATPTTFTFGNLTHTFDGNVKTATVTPNPANATYTASLSAGPAVGSYTVTASATGAYSGSGSATLTISAPASTPTTFSFGNLSHVYDGNIKTATVTPNPGGATYTSSLSSSSPNAGSYPVSATANGSYTGSGNSTLVIDRATPGTNYPGVTISPAAVSIVAGGSVTFTASGGPNGYVWGGSASGGGTTQTVSFPAAGTYNVTVYSPAGGNFYQSNTATAVVTVTTTPVTFTFAALNTVYDGNPKTATVTASDPAATFTADLTKGPNAGTYTVSATATGAYSGSGSATLTIAPAAPVVSLNPPGAAVYVGQSVVFTASGGQNGYIWGGLAVGGGASQSVTFNSPGNFEVNVYSVAGGNYDFSNVARAFVNVTYPPPVITLSIDPPSSAYAPATTRIAWSTQNISSGTVYFVRVFAMGSASEREVVISSVASTDAPYAGNPFTGELPLTVTEPGDYRARLRYVGLDGTPGETADDAALITLQATSGTVLKVGKDKDGNFTDERTTLQDKKTRGKATFIIKPKD